MQGSRGRGQVVQFPSILRVYPDRRRRCRRRRPQFKFHPWHGFVPVDQDAKVETPEDKVFKNVPYRGFVPVEEDEDAEPAEDHPHPYFKKLTNMRYKFVPFQGFVPHVMEEEQVAVEATRKKRETNDEVEQVAKKL